MNFKKFKQISFIIYFFLGIFSSISAQSVDDEFSIVKMKKDLDIFKMIRIKANSGVFKYRTKVEIDSSYNWAFNKIKDSKTYLDFFNIICELTDFEGSTHNSTSFSDKFKKYLKNEEIGYFPLPVKCIEGKMIINIDNEKIPLGAEIISINDKYMSEIIPNLYKYYTTDGINITGKFIGINNHFSKYYRQYYGLQDNFLVTYKMRNSNQIYEINLESISNKEYYKNIQKRFSKPFDDTNYKEWKENEKYSYKNINSNTSLLTINSFAIGENENSPEHLKFRSFLDSTFIEIINKNIKNLILDIRYNGGGTDPNELVAYEYLTQRNFSENKSAYVTFQKIPYLRYIESKVPFFLRPFGVLKYNKYFKNEFSVEKEGKFYQDKSSSDHKVRTQNKNSFDGTIYLLISPRVASAGSNFGSLVASNKNTIAIGEETMGGFYGHNGHTPISYILPNSKIVTTFSVVNLEQDVLKKYNQISNRGIIPDFIVSQTYKDYINQTDTQMNYVLELISNKNK